MFHANSNHESRAQIPRGIDPKTAASQLREILAASGKSQGILSQQHALVEWARREERLLGSPHELATFRPGGLEHLILHDVQGGLVYKLTYGGAFGRTVRRVTSGLSPASPLEYFDRLEIHNNLYSKLTQVVGVFDSAGCPQILVVQKPSKVKFQQPRMLMNSCTLPVLSPCWTLNSHGKAKMTGFTFLTPALPTFFPFWAILFLLT